MGELTKSSSPKTGFKPGLGAVLYTVSMQAVLCRHNVDEILYQLGLCESPTASIVELASCPHRIEEIKQHLEDETSGELREEIGGAILDHLEQFSRGLALNPTAERFAFTLEVGNLDHLYEMATGMSLQEEIEFSLQEFDRQVEERRRRLETRHAWRPEEPQSRVDDELSFRHYKPGSPGWFSGRLNDAPALLGQKLPPQKAEKLAVSLERSLYKYRGQNRLTRSEQTEISQRDTYFSQGLEPRVQFPEQGEAPGVEGYMKQPPAEGPRVLEFPLDEGGYAYLMFDGHHRAAAQMLQGGRTFSNVTVMYLDDFDTRYGLSEQDVLDAIRDLHTHLYMTDRPVPR